MGRKIKANLNTEMSIGSDKTFTDKSDLYDLGNLKSRMEKYLENHGMVDGLITRWLAH
ncbi:hypothetical protein [Winogradskyella sp. MIT101101]|uniref:hypothetical protein n=1 Tax=Winogradskyella sp. MIT101101 TaxID=3098297 RepID=UPI00399ABE65